MMCYLKYFKTELINGLQYRTAAFAGIMTQVVWGFMNIMIYVSFYSHTNSVDSISLPELITYVWLNQAFLILIYMKSLDPEIINKIKNGTVAYELCRPYNLYTWWYIKLISKKYAAVLLRFFPIIVLGLLLPKPFNMELASSFTNFILFIITLILGSILLVSIIMIIQIIGFFTNEDKGIANIIIIIANFLSGATIPVPLLPNIVQMITEYLPFRLISDLPFRIYSGNIGIGYALKSVLLQIIWILILISIGRIIMNKVLKKVSIQGG